MSYSVQRSVDECNARYGGIFKPLQRICPQCGKDTWRTVWGINSAYKSQYNPGEYCEFICACGYSSGEEPC